MEIPQATVLRGVVVGVVLVATRLMERLFESACFFVTGKSIGLSSRALTHPVMTRCPDCRLAVEPDTDAVLRRCEPCRTLAAESPRIRVTPLDRSDLELVKAWRSNPEIYRHFRAQAGPLEWDDHIEWFESRPSARHDFLIHVGNRRVGGLSISADDEVGIYLGDVTVHGAGIATRSLTWLCERFATRAPLTAEVHEDNDASRRLFTRVGFEHADSEEGWDQYRFEPSR